MFGDRFLDLDVSFSGGVLDSFFQPSGPLDHAQHLAAEAFGSDYTFFITCGTTTANHVAIDAMTPPGARVLLDPSAHQSLHFAFAARDASIELIPVLPTEFGATEQPAPYLQPEHSPFVDLAALPRIMAAARRAGHSYDVVALSAASYDGIRYRMEELLPAMVAASADTVLIVDEAWGAIHAFHPELRRHSTLAAVRALPLTDPRPTVLVTHSAHKSMCAARQGSYLHVVGDCDAVHRVQDSLFRLHTTSPSWPVLASLDLARAHAQERGEELVGRVLELARRFRAAVETDPRLSRFRVTEPSAAIAPGTQLAVDPLRVRLQAPGVGSGRLLRHALFEDYGIYVARSARQEILLHFHIGVTAENLQRLVDALAGIATRRHRRARGPVLYPAPGDRADSFYVAYPPGIPTVRPGQIWKEENAALLNAAHASGAQLFQLAAPGVRCLADTSTRR